MYCRYSIFYVSWKICLFANFKLSPVTLTEPQLIQSSWSLLSYNFGGRIFESKMHHSCIVVRYAVIKINSFALELNVARYSFLKNQSFDSLTENNKKNSRSEPKILHGLSWTSGRLTIILIHMLFTRRTPPHLPSRLQITQVRIQRLSHLIVHGQLNEVVLAEAAQRRPWSWEASEVGSLRELELATAPGHPLADVFWTPLLWICVKEEIREGCFQKDEQASRYISIVSLVCTYYYYLLKSISL